MGRWSLCAAGTAALPPTPAPAAAAVLRVRRRRAILRR
jgi:hypothetical protein